MTQISVVRGDLIFLQWENGIEEFRKKEHQLRLLGFRKVEHDFDFLNIYVTYKLKKKRIILTILLS